MKTTKQKLAIRLLSNAERKTGISPFLSKAWTERKEMRAKKELERYLRPKKK